MGTYAATQNCMRKGYGLEPGCRADLVAVDVPTPAEALKSLNPCLLCHKGREYAIQAAAELIDEYTCFYNHERIQLATK